MSTHNVCGCTSEDCRVNGCLMKRQRNEAGGFYAADRQRRGGPVFAWYDPTTGLFTRNKDDPDSGIPAGSCLWPLYIGAPNADQSPQPAESTFTTPDCPRCGCVQDGQCLCNPSRPSAEPVKQSLPPLHFLPLSELRELAMRDCSEYSDDDLAIAWELFDRLVEGGRITDVAEPESAKCAECGAEMIHVRPGKWQHPDCPQSPRAAEPVAPQPAQPSTEFEDPRVQLVYGIICGGHEPPDGEHWDGYVSRLIVDALQSQDREDAERRAGEES